MLLQLLSACSTGVFKDILGLLATDVQQCTLTVNEVGPRGQVLAIVQLQLPYVARYTLLW